MSKIYCEQPFYFMEIDWKGDVCVCCNKWCRNYSLGNLFENSITEIWYGEKRRKFIEQFETQNFEYCDIDICPAYYTCDDTFFPYFFEEMKNNERSKFIRITYDRACNINCIFCRDPHRLPSKEEVEGYEKLSKKIMEILPFLNEKKALISLNGCGEVFYSKWHINLIREVVEKYPNINFEFVTNGILCSEKTIKSLGLENRIDIVEVSVHATEEKTYNKMCLGADFNKVKENLNYLSSLQKEGKIKDLVMNFVINSINYKEMESFCKWAFKLNARPQFLSLLNLHSDRLYNELNIADPDHPKYEDFVKYMKKDIFRDKRVRIPDSSFNLK